MPLDGFNYRPEPEADVLPPGLEGLKQLSRALRERMPEGFRWNYDKALHREGCGSVGCAMGLARVKWPDQIHDAWMPEMARHFGLSRTEANRIFLDAGAYGVPWNCVTPVMVADAIDALVAKKEAALEREAVHA